MSSSSGDLLRENASNDAHVTRVFFDGAERTKKSALLTESRPLFGGKTLGDLVVNAYRVKNQMEKDGLFESVNVLIDVDKSPKAQSNGYEVTFIGKEPKISKGKVTVDVSNRGEGTLTLAGQGFNIFGSGEAAVAEVSRGSQSTTSARLDFIKPLLKCRDARLGLSLSRMASSYPWSSFGSTETALGVDLVHEPIANLLMHRLKYIASWRKVKVTSNETPFSIRQHAGHSLKSSLQSTLTYDSRDDRILASKGVVLGMTNELAGLGGNAHFFRQELQAGLSSALPYSFILSFGFRTTFVRPLGPQREAAQSSLSIVDRTFLGGSTDLRGFDYNGAGPKEDDCYLGGMASWCGALHLYKRLWPTFLFAHSFASMGNIFPVSADTELRPMLSELIQEPRCAVGFGFVIKVNQILRLEFNYCLPMIYRETDKTKHGFQFGIGLNFV